MCLSVVITPKLKTGIQSVQCLMNSQFAISSHPFIEMSITVLTNRGIMLRKVTIIIVTQLLE